MLAVPGALAQTKSHTAESAGIEVWDGTQLYHRALQAGIQAPRFLATPDMLLDQVETDREGADLLLQLEQVAPGPEWRRYESLCEDLLTYLFCPPLDIPIPQLRDEQDANRRDFILPNYTAEDFWHFMRLHYQADYVVVEAKNWQNKLDKSRVLQLKDKLDRARPRPQALLLASRSRRRGGPSVACVA